MEVVMTEEKKKIFRARKTMKISDRQQLETLHSTLLTSPSGLSNSPPPSLVNGTHKEDGQKPGEQVDLESKSPNATTPTSPAPFLSLNLSPSPASSDGSKTKEEALASPGSPFHSLNSELKKLENSDNVASSSPTSNLDISAPNEPEGVQGNSDEQVGEGKKVESEKKEDLASLNSVKDTDDMLSHSPVGPSACCEPMETDSDTSKSEDAVVTEDTTDKNTDKKPSSPKSSNDAPPSSAPVTEQEDEKEEIKEEIKKEIKDEKATAEEFKKEPVKERKDIEVKKEIKKEKNKITKQSRPSSTPPSSTVKEEKSSTSGLKRTLSEGFDPNDCSLKRDVKKRKMDGDEFEAQLELKITAKASGHRKIEKIVQKLLEEKLRVLELTIFDKNLQELKDRVDQIECSTKHQTAINTLQVKLARLAKKFGEANQASENKKKQEALAAAAAAAVAAAANAATTNTTPAAVAPPNKTVSNIPKTQRPARTSVEVKQTTGTAQSTSSSAPASVASSVSVPVSSNTTLVPQTPILQLIASTSNAVTNLTASTTQSSPGTLLLKTAPGSGVMAPGQPLLIQLPLSMANGQTGTLVNIPVSTFNAATSLNKTKTTAPTTTFILKSAPTPTSATSSLTAATVPALTAPASQVPSSQISLPRVVYQGGAGGITTPNAGISVTTARAATQAVSVAGAMSSTSSPITSGPAATGSTAPGAPQGTSLTTKTDNQATASTPSKVPALTTRPKGSVIDLTEEDDDVLVTGVKSATTPNAARPQTSVPSAARSSPQSNQNSTNNLQLSAHHRPPLDLASKTRTQSNSTPTRAGSVSLPPLPVAPVPPRLPPEAEKTSPPQQPQLKLVPNHTGIVLSWCVAETDTTCAAVDSYHLYAFHQDNSNSNPSQQHWKKIGEVKALPLPMACTLTQFQSGSTYNFAVRAKDIYGRFGAFCEPQCTNVISSSSS